MRLDGDPEAAGLRVARHDAVRHAGSLAVSAIAIHSSTASDAGDDDGDLYTRPTRNREPEEREMKAFIVELPNQPGSLAMVAEAVAEKGINITGVAGATSGELGSVSFTTDDESGTRTALGAKGWVYREVPIVRTSMEHRPGTLAAAARRLAGAGPTH